MKKINLLLIILLITPLSYGYTSALFRNTTFHFYLSSRYRANYDERISFLREIAPIPDEYFKGLDVVNVYDEGEIQNCIGNEEIIRFIGFYWWYGDREQTIDMCYHDLFLMVHELTHHKNWVDGENFYSSIYHYNSVFGKAEDDIYDAIERVACDEGRCV